MNISDGDGSKVYRLRQLPSWASTRADVASLISRALELPVDQLTVCSVAKSSYIWEAEPTWVATIQLQSLPRRVREFEGAKEWTFSVSADGSGHGSSETSRDGDTVLILDCHFEGMTVLNDVDPAIHCVRAIIYGYNSTLVGSKSFQSISDIAQTLIFQLKAGGWNLTATTASSSRPIIFLAHSLGGLVLKDAIIHMADRESSVSSILHSLRGAIMFGVPSLGMEQSHLMAMVEGQSNEDLVYDLSREGGANYLRRLNEQFDGLSFVKSARILWAYETEESPTVVRLEDGTWSKTGPPSRLDHSSMVKFTRGDANLHELAHGNGLRHRESSRQSPPSESNIHPWSYHPETHFNPAKLLQEFHSILQCLEDLRSSVQAPELDHRIKNIEDPFADTFAWMFDMPEFIGWLQGGSGLFWIHGKPGSGKSTLMKFIVRHELTWSLLHQWKANKVEIKANFFFHYRGSAIQKSFEGLLRGLVVQILAAHLEQYHPQSLWKEYLSLSKKRDEWRQTAREPFFRLEDIEKEVSRVKSQLSRAGESSATATRTTRGSRRDSTLKDSPTPTSGYLSELEEEFEEVQKDHVLVKGKLATVPKRIAHLANEIRPYTTTAETKFLAAVADKWRAASKNSLILRLESILRLMLEQNIVGMDLVLFFDALDEFDGHLDMLSRFIKSLVDSPGTSSMGTRVKQYTQHDIEQYAAGPLVTSLIPTVISRANGVFLWVTLAVRILDETVKSTQGPGDVGRDLLEKRLLELPSDLLDFYELIIERIKKPVRRYTFALLELLVRHTGSSPTAKEIRDAVRISACRRFQDATKILDDPELRNTPHALNGNELKGNMCIRKAIKVVDRVWYNSVIRIRRRVYI
ncbi:hypothetical protein B0T16DRAFT_385604 [Cercophora newfieldiana]|uniref:Nephrocystin 3-like N-terminal domain-containing protein n=1 Tax=Cercophora newfieldiana TaxID=92897 RepID=A0AA39YQW0_9PEZI|nr:hypothetical protein B0T16DRAFT_385604 [Cercophora newfieldiana]